jgi:formylglycine-generating enzyme required for sulfatase activity
MKIIFSIILSIALTYPILITLSADNHADVVTVLTDDGVKEEPTPSKIRQKDNMKMRLIPAGDFSMGDHHAAGEYDAKPVHTVYLSAYYIDETEVTNEQYCLFLNDYGKNTDAAFHKLLSINSESCLIEKIGNAYKPKSGYAKHPVVMVSWHGAAAYAQWAGARLPTEAQWEKAARGGLAGKKYPWGDLKPDGSNANFADKNTTYYWSDKTVDDGYGLTAPVGNYVPNGYGLFDMAGNVWEWCADEYDSDYYSKSPKNNPKGPGVALTFLNNDFTNIATSRVLRGGSWQQVVSILRCAYRYSYYPMKMHDALGFRCCSR